MNIRPNSKLSRADAERLLDGGTAGTPRLRQLLAAASMSVENRAGEEIAVAHFHQAGEMPAPRRRRLAVMKSSLAAAITSKVLIGGVAAAAVAASGGLALVAYHGVQNGHHTDPTVVTTTTATTTATASATPSPSLAGLCIAYQAGATSNSGKATDSPAFQALVSAAGLEGVDDFCASLATALPTQATDHPTGKPTALPTQATDHPTGKPTALPTQVTDHPTSDASGATSNRP